MTYEQGRFAAQSRPHLDERFKLAFARS